LQRSYKEPRFGAFLQANLQTVAITSHTQNTIRLDARRRSCSKLAKAWTRLGITLLRNLRLIFARENDPEHIFVPAGLIVNGGANLSVVGHVCMDSKASWEVVSKEEDQ
jgi:hypothetical protein